MDTIIDLRSDTVTRPTEAMRRAMHVADVGDDVFGEDPTARWLEERVAELLGKEAALFVPSGVMGNQLALRSQTSPGDEVIVDALSHIYNYESGAAAALVGVQLHIIHGERGIPTPAQVDAAVRPGNYWDPQTRMICLENTVNKAGGAVVELDVIEGIGEVARRHGLCYHLDGARLWNASAATGISEARFAAPFDTVMVCLSKGLGAPVGSVLAGDSETIRRAHRYRKMYGGGMRQIGMLAAAGLYAIEHNRERLADDHANARRLAEGLSAIKGLNVNIGSVATNIVLFDTQDPAERVVSSFREVGVLVTSFGPNTVRAITHLDISRDQIDQALHRLQRSYLPSIPA